MKADPSQKGCEEAELAAGLGPDLSASVETTYSEQSSSSAGSTSSSDQPIYFRYDGAALLFSSQSYKSRRFRACVKVSLLLCCVSGSFVSPLKCLSGWTIMASMWSLNR